MTEKPIGYLELLRTHRDYRRIWLGEVVSFLGDWLNLIALYAVVMQLTGSAAALAAVTIAKTLPIFLVSPLAGSIVDRHDRRTVMLVSDGARAVCAAGLIAAHHLGSLVLVYVVLVVMVAFSGLFIPARSAAIPQVTTPRSLLVANALSSGTWSVMLAVGAALGGLLTEHVGIDHALALDGLTFLVSAAFLWGLPPLPPTGEGERKSTGTFAEGLRYAAERPFVAAVLLLKSAMALSSGVMVMLPIYGSRLFAGTEGPLYIGILYAARGLGALIGSVLVGRVRDEGGRLKHLATLGFVMIAVFLVMAAFAPDVWTSAFAFLAATVGVGVVWVASTTMLQVATDGDFRGRMFAYEFGLMTLLTSLAAWLAGAAVDDLGASPRTVVLWSGLVMLPPAVLWELAVRRAGIAGSGRA